MGRSAESKRVAVAMSGGVDSSVAAYLLKEHGYEVFGVFARCWDASWEEGGHQDGVDGAEQRAEQRAQREQQRGQREKSARPCMSYEQDYQDVSYTCALLDIPFYTVDLTEQYYRDVFALFLEGYRGGETPNPDILCNQKIKFHHLYDYARRELQADLFATGHYCVREGYGLYRGEDVSKDQSYFLYAVPRECLPYVLFPVGKMLKSRVRELALKAGLPTAHKKDSTGLCFVGKRSFRYFLAGFIPAAPGTFQTLDGQVVGQHEGAHLYTPGQRRHLGLGGPGERWYVVKKDMAKQVVYVVRGDDPCLYHQELVLEHVCWLESPEEIFACEAVIRYQGAAIPCTVRVLAPERVDVVLSTPQKGLALAQSVVFYRGRRCLGGGRVRAMR